VSGAGRLLDLALLDEPRDGVEGKWVAPGAFLILRFLVEGRVVVVVAAPEEKSTGQ
jgi:hypothetical protein